MQAEDEKNLYKLIKLVCCDIQYVHIGRQLLRVHKK